MVKKIITIKMSGNNFLVEKKNFTKYLLSGFGCEYSKGFLSLNFEEVLYLKEKGCIEIFKSEKVVSFEDLKKNKNFDFEKYLVYRDLKKKGYVVKSALKYGCNFRVYEKKDFKTSHAKYLVEILNEKSKIVAKEIVAKTRISNSTKKKFLYAIVDCETFGGVGGTGYQ